MDKQEMKAVIFKKNIYDLWKNIGEVKANTLEKNPMQILLGDKSNNKFVQVILDASFSKELVEPFDCEDIVCSSLENIEDVIEECKACSACAFYSCSLSGQMIFFSLLAAAMEKDMYEDRIELIADFAALIGFNTMMMEDWLYAAKTVLMGRKISLEGIKTDEGKNFFSDMA